MPVREDNIEVLKNRILRKLNISDHDLKEFFITKKSIDARDKNNVFFVYEVNAKINNEQVVVNRLQSIDVEVIIEEEYVYPRMGNNNLEKRPVIVGSGPSGLFCALLLAECGYRPIVIERGEKIEYRVNTVETFWKDGRVNPNSNVCFGEGGAGTFSDGKLNTLNNDIGGRIRKVYKTFVECGANEEILYDSKPHIGTDILRNVIVNLRNRIIDLGGEFLFNSCMTDITIFNNRIQSIIINNSKIIETDVLVLALGHSAKDTISMLYSYDMGMVAKPFAVGVRIQHKQDMINRSQYGEYSSYLPAASYKLTYTAKNKRGVYSFCMCPGGYVVNSSCENNQMIINGMSNHARDGENANSAIVVTVGLEDFGNDPIRAMDYQRSLERKAFEAGNGKIPTQLFGDYLRGVKSNHFEGVNPVFKGDYSFADLNEIFPKYINEALKEGIQYFDTKIKGFGNKDAILSAVESRTSSAIRILRNDDFESNILGIYPVGEGAGYSGGITTSSVDGLRAAEKIIEKYTNRSLNS